MAREKIRTKTKHSKIGDKTRKTLAAAKAWLGAGEPENGTA